MFRKEMVSPGLRNKNDDDTHSSRMYRFPFTVVSYCSRVVGVSSTKFGGKQKLLAMLYRTIRLKGSGQMEQPIISVALTVNGSTGEKSFSLSTLHPDHAALLVFMFKNNPIWQGELRLVESEGGAVIQFKPAKISGNGS